MECDKDQKLAQMYIDLHYKLDSTCRKSVGESLVVSNEVSVTDTLFLLLVTHGETRNACMEWKTSMAKVTSHASNEKTHVRTRMVSVTCPRVVDIGVNLTHKAFQHRWKEVVHQSIDAGVDALILTGTCLERSQQCMGMAQEWFDETKTTHTTPNLYFTVGIHPHDAKTWDDETTATAMKELLQHPLAVAVGECGLDYNRNYSSKEDQRHAFASQVKLACDCKMPLFLHEREAHEDLIEILDEIAKSQQEQQLALPPIVVHCFTGTESEAMAYIERGFCLGFTGTICKKERGAPLRALLSRIPLERIMVETDAPFMGFQKGKRKSSIPADCPDVARQIAITLGVSFEEVCESTTRTAQSFFGLAQSIALN